MNAPAVVTQPRINSFARNTNVAAVRANTGGRVSTDAVAGTGSFLQSWGAVLLVVIVLVVLFAVYYKTVGYYINLGWEKLGWSRRHGESVEINVPGGPAATLTPSPASSPSIASDIETDLEGVGKRLERDVEAALGSARAGGKQVFNVARNVYTFGEAEPLCRAFGAELATYDQVKDAYEAGADWCNYGWVKGQLAVYPTQKSTYDKLQHGPEHERMTCGLPGVNGGYFPNADQRFGVNCYGSRPAESALDERMQMEAKTDTSFDREVNHFKAERDSIAVNPWSAKQWAS
jgi:hypothetical protein